MLNFLGSLINNNGASFVADFFSVIFGMFGSVVTNFFTNIINFVWNFICKWVWTVCKWVLGVLDIMQLGFSRLIGLDLGTGDTLTYGDYIDGLKHITVSGGSNYYDYLMKIFRALIVVAIVLMIIFTIYAMIMQEYKMSITGYAKADNQKGKFFKRIFTNIITICLIPMIFYTIIVGTNAILTSFYRALGGYSNTTIAGNVLSASTYDANRYRSYANANKRIPITIEVYSTENAFGKTLSDEDVSKQIKDTETQQKLRAIAGAFANDSFLPFNQSTIYSNGIWSNYSNYSLTYNNTVYENLGQYFENFICTREQYYVLADFIDYCQLYNVNYYVKAISETDICWKYVDNIQAQIDSDGNALGDLTLTVSYRDAETINYPSETANASSSTNDVYSLQFTTKLDVTSPISDALKTASTLLGINESTSKFNAMERDDSGDFVNLVNWSTRKVHLKLSDSFALNNTSSWTFSDQIIIYEYFRFQNDYSSTNNTLEDYTLDELKSDGAYLSAMELTYRNYNSNTGSYSSENTLYCVNINGNYYRITESDEDFDDYGTAYFELDAVDRNVDYFDTTVVMEKLSAKATVKLSASFNINNPSGWSFTDQVLVYEYFKDLSLSNGIRRTHMFSDFIDGVEFDIYKIESKYYVYINGTFYESSSIGVLSGAVNYLVDSESAGERWFGYTLTNVEKDKYGINDLNSLFKSVSGYTEADSTNAFYQKYSSINMKLSEDFSFYNSDTWTFRDYVIMKIFVDKLSSSSKYSIDMLKNFGLQGKIVYKGSNYYLRLVNGENVYYLDLNAFSKTSEEKICETISSAQFEKIGLDLSSIGLVYTYNDNLETDILLGAEVGFEKFYLSENFNAYNPKTWTVGDYVLLYLNEYGLISGDIEHLKDDGYNALIYEVDDNKYYRFGKLNERGEISEGTIFFDNDKILELGSTYSISNLFKTNLMSFVLSKNYSGQTINDLVYTESTFGGGLIGNTSSYIYNINSSYSNINNLQYILAEDFLKKSDIITNEETVKYNYVNPALITSDPTTWTILDTVIYIKTGTLPSIDEPFETFLCKSNDGKIYMFVDDVLIDITSSNSYTPSYYSGAEMITNQVFANKKWQCSDDKGSELSTRYKSYFINNIKDNISEDNKVGTFVYYSSILKGTGSPKFAKNSIYSDMDIVLVENSVELTSLGVYKFDAFIDDDVVYLKFRDGCFFAITESENAYIYYKSNSILPDITDASLKAFESSGEYTAFNGSTNEFSRMDSIIYSVTGSDKEVIYKKYHSKMKSGPSSQYGDFLLINGELISFSDDDADAVINIESERTKNNDYLNVLYDEFYKDYVSSSAPTIKKIYSSNITMTTSFDLTQMSTWTALELIFSKNGIDNPREQCRLVESSNGGYYLYCQSKGIYIRLSGIASVQVEPQVDNTIKITVNSVVNLKQFRWRIASIDYNETTEKYYSKTVKKLAEYKVGVYVKQSKNVIESITNVFTTSETEALDLSGKTVAQYYASGAVTRWSWYGLLEMYLDPEEKYGNDEPQKIYYNGKVYYVFHSFSSVYYVPEVINLDSGGTAILKDSFSGTSVTRNTSSPVISGSKLYNVLQKEGMKINAVITKYTTKFTVKLDGINESKIEFYTVQKEGSETWYAIYNLKDAGDGVDSIQYVKVNVTSSVSGTVYTFATTSTESEAMMFSVYAKSRNDILEWSVFDFVFAYVTQNTLRTHISSYVYVLNSKYYIKYDDKYILIPTNTANLSSWLTANSSSFGEINTDVAKLYDTANYNDYLVKYDECGEALKTAMNEYVDSKKRENVEDADKIHKIEFSNVFDYSDYESWTIADYVMYYAVANGLYGTDSEFSIDFPFTYIPGFSEKAGVYYKLTYLDLILAKIYGESGDKYVYLNNSSSHYEFTLVYKSQTEFYIKINNGIKDYFIPLSDNVTLDFTTMTISSTDLNENLTTDDVRTKLNNYESNGVILCKNNVTGLTTYQSTYNCKNFQTFVSTHGAPVYIYYLLKENETTGSVEIEKVINFAQDTNKAKTGMYFSYEKFYEYYGRKLSSYLLTEKIHELNIAISMNGTGSADFKYKTNYEKIYPDFVFDNYYYYYVDVSKFEDAGIINFAGGLDGVNSSVADTLEAIKQGTTSLPKSSLNVKLSDGFDVNNINTWSVLDAIIMYEYSREGIRYNKFKNIKIDELKTEDFFLTIYVKESGDPDIENTYYLYLNYNFYKLDGIIKINEDGTFYVADTHKKIVSCAIDSTPEAVGDDDDTSLINGKPVAGFITKQNSDGKTAGVSSFDIRIKFETKNFSINPNYTKSRTINREENNISYTIGNKTYFRYIDTNVADTNYRINTSNYGLYTIKTLIKTVSWVEKLMGDMQVYYPDLNWGVLLATDGWIDTLGDFTSAYTSGLYTGGDNSSNTTAAGLVLSEFFMSVATEVDSSYANYEYSSVFDEDTIKSLMLSLVGEESYNALVFEAEVFMDYFNSCFAPIIDDFAKEFGENIGENSLRLNAYKSYLATLLLSSDIGEYLYTIATRVYAEYTIGEYLANAAGDYASYYAYANNLKDEEGNLVSSYEFGTFAELIIYENEYCGNYNPTFTFNFKKAFEHYGEEKLGIITYKGLTYAQAISSTTSYEYIIGELVEEIKTDYKKIYKQGYTINENGEVIDETGEIPAYYKSQPQVYCYMIHVLYSIKNSITSSEPTYLRCYERYIDGDIARWDIIKGEDISEADQYIENYDSAKKDLVTYQMLSSLTIMRSFLPSVSLGTDGDASFWDKMKEVWNIYKDFLTGNVQDLANEYMAIPISNVYFMLKDSTLSADVSYFFKNAFSISIRMGNTSSTTESIAEFINAITPIDLTAETSWEIINEFYDCVSRIVSELIDVRILLPGELTENGSTRGDYSDNVIDMVISAFQDIKYNLNQYISAQRQIDVVEKRSITFTLAQYGANYVSTGYKFSVRNKEYTFKSTTDPLRLAEYVYGGAFLESVGVGAQYTSSDFTGIVKASKVYDNVDKVLKTNLDSWSELRTFASEIASKTAELYFLTNLSDLDISKDNAIKINDKISSSGTSSIEEWLYGQITSQIDIKIVARITNTFNADGSAPATVPVYTHERFIAISKYLFRNDVSDEDLEGITLEQFKRLAINEIIANKDNAEESAEEKAGRFMTLFNIISYQVYYETTVDSVVQGLGRVLKSSKIDKTGTGINYKIGANSYAVTANFSSSSSTLESVKTLAGLENRPTREILTRQYGGTRTTDYYDEAYGDTFIACTYKNGLYYPILTSGSRNCTDTKYKKYCEDGLLDTQFITSYCSNDSSVVVMKGIITADGNPTAIRKYNNSIEIDSKKLLKTTTTTYNSVTYYRTNIGGTMSAGDDLVSVSRAVSRVTTKNYTKYVYGTSFTTGIGGTTTYTGKTNLRTIVNSDYTANYAQLKAEYLMGQADDYGAISVLDDFSYFYIFGGMTWMLLMLAFITVIPIMINAIGGAATRIFDMIVLFLASPIVISLNSLYDGKNKAYDAWKKNIQSTLLGVLGYILGFSSFSLMVPLIYNTKTFVSYATYKKVMSISGIGSFFTYQTVNSLVRYLWVITAVTLITKVPKTLLPIITANNGDLKTPDPSLDGSGKPFIDKSKELMSSLEKSVDKISSVVTGRAMVGLMQTVKDEFIDMIPGSAAARKIKSKVDEKAKKVKMATSVAAGKAVEAALTSVGVDPKLAKAAGDVTKKAGEEAIKKQEQHKKFKENAKKEFQKNFM